MAKRFAFGRPPQSLSDLLEADNLTLVADALLSHFFQPRPPPPPRLTLLRHKDYSSLTTEEGSRALAPSSNPSAPGPDHIPYSVWKSLHHIRPCLLSCLLDPLLAHAFHPPSLKKALGIVLDKPGKPAYDSPSSFRVIVLLHTLSKVLSKIAASRLSLQDITCLLIHPLQCGFLTGKSTMDTARVVQPHAQSLHRDRHKVSTLFLDLKGSCENVELSVLLSLLCHKGVSPYLIHLIGSFLRDRTCRLSLQRFPRTFPLVSVGVPQSSAISPLLFVIYVSSLHTDIPNGLTIFSLDDFAFTVASPSYRKNVRLLQRAFSTLQRRPTSRTISFSVLKTELMDCRTPRKNQPRCGIPVHLEGLVFYPQNCLKWLSFLFTPSFDPRALFSLPLSLPNALFARIRHLSPPGVGLPPHLYLPRRP